MVEINDNVRRSSICWHRGRRELITDVENQKCGYDVIVAETIYTVTPITLANLSR